MSLKNILKNSGVLGAGGAGFPTYVKASSKIEYFLANGAECEPLLHKDYELMINYPNEIVSGMKIMMEETGAKKGYFGVKAKNSLAVEKIKEAIEGSNIEICLLGDFYPSGDEYELVYEATKRLMPPHGIPLDVGCVVNNVETLFNVHESQKGNNLTQKFISVNGAIKNPSSFFVPIGTSFREVIEFAGGSTIEDFTVFVSGLMMGSISTNLDDVINKTCGGLILLPNNHYMVQRMTRTSESMNRIGKSACDQCSYCTEFCPRYLLGYDIQPHKVMRSLVFNLAGQDLWNQYADLCCSCGLCSLYACPEDLYPREACIQSMDEMKKQGKSYEQTKEVKVHPIKEGRRVPLKKLMKKLDVEHYNKPTPFNNNIIEVNKVKVLLNQHIGKPAHPVVQKNDSVELGQLIANVEDADLGVFYHSSVNGKVIDVTQNFIVIEKII